MRRPLIAGNWKMNLKRDEAVNLARGVGAAAGDGEVDVLVCPSFVYLDAVSQAVQGSKVAVGGQMSTLKKKEHLLEKPAPECSKR